MDPALRHCLSKEGIEAERCVRNLCESKVRPILERSLKPRFRHSTRSGAEPAEDSDYFDVVSDALVVIQRRLMGSNEATPIHDLEAFSFQVAQSAFTAYLRRKYPARYRLSITLRSTLELDPRLAYWRWERAAVGGRNEWAGRAPVLTPRAKLVLESPEQAQRECFKGRNPGDLLVSDLLLTLYAWLERPFEFHYTIDFCRVSLCVEDISEEPIGEAEENFSRPRPPDDDIRARGIGQGIWQTLSEISTERRGIFLLFEPPGQDQDHLIDQLILHSVATLEQIAEAAGITFDKLCELLQKERVTYEDIAAIYGMSPKEAEGVRRGVLELLQRRLIKNGFWGDA